MLYLMFFRPYKDDAHLETFRVPSVVKRPSKSRSTHSPDKRTDNVIPMKMLKANPDEEGLDNPGFRNHHIEGDIISESEVVYKSQLEDFFGNKGLQIRTDGIFSHHSNHSIAATSSPKPKAKSKIPRRQKDVDEKIIDHGPSKYKLVRI